MLDITFRGISARYERQASQHMSLMEWDNSRADRNLRPVATLNMGPQESSFHISLLIDAGALVTGVLSSKPSTFAYSFIGLLPFPGWLTSRPWCLLLFRSQGLLWRLSPFAPVQGCTRGRRVLGRGGCCAQGCLGPRSLLESCFLFSGHLRSSTCTCVAQSPILTGLLGAASKEPRSRFG